MDKVEIITLTRENKSEFTDMLKQALNDKFGEEIPENYGTLHPWSLLSLIRDDALDTYQLIYVNDNFWTATGGMIREFEGNKVYQSVFRGFSNAENRHKGLGVVSYTHLYCTKYQIERAKELGCHSVIISFNDYNYKLFDITQKYMLPRALPEYKFVASSEPIMFNGVEQWLLTLTF